MRKGIRLFVLLAALAIAAAPSLRAADYPDHAVKVIVPFPPGGATDIVGRILVQKLSERLGMQFFIENIGGAGGNIGMTEAARAARRLHDFALVIEHRGEHQPLQSAAV